MLRKAVGSAPRSHVLALFLRAQRGSGKARGTGARHPLELLCLSYLLTSVRVFVVTGEPDHGVFDQ